MITPEQALKCRQILGLGQKDMARTVGVSLRTWFRYEAGDTPVPLTVEKHLLNILKYDEVRQGVGRDYRR